MSGKPTGKLKFSFFVSVFRHNCTQLPTRLSSEFRMVAVQNLLLFLLFFEVMIWKAFLCFSFILEIRECLLNRRIEAANQSACPDQILPAPNSAHFLFPCALAPWNNRHGITIMIRCKCNYYHYVPLQLWQLMLWSITMDLIVIWNTMVQTLQLHNPLLQWTPWLEHDDDIRPEWKTELLCHMIKWLYKGRMDICHNGLL